MAPRPKSHEQSRSRLRVTGGGACRWFCRAGRSGSSLRRCWLRGYASAEVVDRLFQNFIQPQAKVRKAVSFSRWFSRWLTTTVFELLRIRRVAPLERNEGVLAAGEWHWGGQSLLSRDALQLSAPSPRRSSLGLLVDEDDGARRPDK